MRGRSKGNMSGEESGKAYGDWTCVERRRAEGGRTENALGSKKTEGGGVRVRWMWERNDLRPGGLGFAQVCPPSPSCPQLHPPCPFAVTLAPEHVFRCVPSVPASQAVVRHHSTHPSRPPRGRAPFVFYITSPPLDPPASREAHALPFILSLHNKNRPLTRSLPPPPFQIIIKTNRPRQCRILTPIP